MNFLPIFLKLQHQPCLVVGGGNTATRKVELLLRVQAKVIVIAPQVSEKIKIWVAENKLVHHAREFVPTDLQTCRLVIAATNNKLVNQQVATLGHMQNLFVNVIDQPKLGSFIVPSIIDRHPVQVAISTGGASPILARLLRARLETVIPSAFGQLAEFVENFRESVKARFPELRQRRRFWESVLQGSISEMLLSGHTKEARTALEQRLENPDEDRKTTYGEVYLVGGGPGDPDLLTFRALRLMQQADVVVYDRLISPAVLALTRREAERVYVGKEPNHHTLPQQDINKLLIIFAKQGKRVLRLKGGDPFMFGRGGEEIETLMEEGIPFQVVPGITAALGAGAYAGIPLTHRDYAQSCIFVTGHLKDNTMNLNWQVLAQQQQTIVVYMGLRGVEILCRELIAHGLPPTHPAALVQQATTRQQKVLIATLESLPTMVSNAQITLPSLIIVGEVVKLHEKLAWFDASTVETFPNLPEEDISHG
jgi:uroporphyrin-III C-methyltransferase/precorrin-2 dehydrogenase/sirohydrochlorin ferrochelatase